MEFMDSMHAWIGDSEGDISVLQMCARALVIFLWGLVLVRLAGKRVFGKWGAIDILLAIIVGSNLSRTMTGGAPLLPTLAATTLLVALHAVLVALAARVPGVGPMLKGKPVRIIADGQPDRRALRNHGVGDGDLQAAYRCAGVAGPGEIKEAWIERNGEISIVKR